MHGLCRGCPNYYEMQSLGRLNSLRSWLETNLPTKKKKKKDMYIIWFLKKKFFGAALYKIKTEVGTAKYSQ